MDPDGYFSSCVLVNGFHRFDAKTQTGRSRRSIWGGVTDQMWGAQTTNVLQKATVTLAIIFFVITLVLAVLVGKQQEHSKTELNPQATGSDSTGAGPSGSNNENGPSIIDLGPQGNSDTPD